MRDAVSKNRSSHRRCSVNKVFLIISQNSQENTCTKVSFLIKLQAKVWCFPVNFAKLLKTTFFNRTPPGACFCKNHLKIIKENEYFNKLNISLRKVVLETFDVITAFVL